MFCKKYGCVIILLLCSLPLCAQIQKFKRGLNFLVVDRPAVSDKLGHAILRDNAQRRALQSSPGLAPILQQRTRHSLLDWFNKNINRELQDSSLPGFEEDWTLALQQYSKLHWRQDFWGDMQAALSILYPGARFTPLHAVSFADVLAFSRQPYQKGVRLSKGFLAKWNEKNVPPHFAGFIVLRVEGKYSRPKDVLILDIKEEKIYSLFKSQGAAIAREFMQRKQAWARRNKEMSKRLQRQGFVIDEEKNLISKDGVSWTDLNTLPNAACFWYVWKNNLKVKFNRGSWSGQVLQVENTSLPVKK